MSPINMPWITENPFFILEILPSATRGEIERKAQKLLHMLQIQLREVEFYSTPLGQFERTEQKIRRSLAVLRDPNQRIMYEFWAQGNDQLCKSCESQNQVQGETEPLPIQWSKGFRALGWRCL